MALSEVQRLALCDITHEASAALAAEIEAEPLWRRAALREAAVTYYEAMARAARDLAPAREGRVVPFRRPC